MKQTLNSTSQLARMVIRYPLRRYYKSRAPFLNVSRLDEVVSTDPFFANCPSLNSGYLGAQVFYGLTSHCINVYGFKSKGEFPIIYRDFIHKNGAPSTLRRDNAKEEQRKLLQRIQQQIELHYLIGLVCRSCLLPRVRRFWPRSQPRQLRSRPGAISITQPNGGMVRRGD